MKSASNSYRTAATLMRDILDGIEALLAERPMLAAVRVGSTTLGNQRAELKARLNELQPDGPNDEQVWLENELMACMQIVAPGMGSAMPDEITYAIMVTAIRRLIECDTERYEALLERWQKRTRATGRSQE